MKNVSWILSNLDKQCTIITTLNVSRGRKVYTLDENKCTSWKHFCPLNFLVLSKCAFFLATWEQKSSWKFTERLKRGDWPQLEGTLSGQEAWRLPQSFPADHLQGAKLKSQDAGSLVTTPSNRGRNKQKCWRQNLWLANKATKEQGCCTFLS